MTASRPSTLSLLERRLRMLTHCVVAEGGVYVRFLDNGDEIAINADAMMDTMSLIKVPLLVSLMRRVDRGEVDLGRRITLAEDQKRLARESFVTLKPAQTSPCATPPGSWRRSATTARLTSASRRRAASTR